MSIFVVIFLFALIISYKQWYDLYSAISDEIYMVLMYDKVYIAYMDGNRIELEQL